MRNVVGFGRKEVNLKNVRTQPIRKGQYETDLMRVDPFVYNKTPTTLLEYNQEYGNMITTKVYTES